ncbi:site-specific integrase [Nitratidesulfovibrio liaohensis]|uniref:Site-specific integrase n=1 Tax=Nitratidesulfovibrio liaohensis TaxID=2604158 RepID=A0ABY9R254_9BACT|nr:site-specific integrase [Nitratidesulfovibrio liaohensis]WMW65702.1 site-specific integrase [Nitratidesulfovibrio liaohensis]
MMENTTPSEDMRELARKWLDEALHDEYETLLIRGPVSTPGELKTREEQAAHLYSTLMEAQNRKDYRHTAATAREVLQRAGYPATVSQRADFGGKSPSNDGTPTNDGTGTGSSLSGHPRASKDGPTNNDRSRGPVSRLQFLKLCDALLLAQAAVIESASSPTFTGELTARPDFRLSAVRTIMDAPGWQPQITAPHPASDSAQASPTTATTAAQTLTLSAAVEKYIKAKDPELAEGSKRNVYVNVRQFAEAIAEARGRDIALSELDRDTIRAYGNLMAAQPANPKSKEYAGKRLNELAALNLPAEKRLSAKTLSTKFNMIRSLINWMELEYGIVARPLNAAFVIPKVQGKVRAPRRPFTTEELQRLFTPRSYLHATRQSPAYFWTPLIALFSGMRLEEIAQLLVTDIRLDEGVWCIDVNEAGDGKHVKTDAGKRLVPLHPFLINGLGFLRFVEEQKAAGHVRLFPDLKREKRGNVGGPITSWFTRYRRKLGIGGADGEESSVVFHCFRNTVINHLETQARANLRLIQKVVGHRLKGGDIGITERYIGKYPTATLRDEVIAVLPWAEQLPLALLTESRWAGK